MISYSPIRLFRQTSVVVLITSALFFMSGQAIARDQISSVGYYTVYPFNTWVLYK